MNMKGLKNNTFLLSAPIIKHNARAKFKIVTTK